MRLEIKSAANFLMNLLRMNNSINEQQLESFRGKLEDLLRTHYQHHWFPEKPCKGSGYRCLRINHKMDPIIARAAEECGVTSTTGGVNITSSSGSGVRDSSQLHTLLPHELTLWIDPKEVSYRIGENGSICVLYDGNLAPVPVERYSTCKESLRGLDNMIMDPRNMHFVEQLTAYVSS